MGDAAAKRCPECGAESSHPGMSFCQQDGTQLVDVASDGANDDPLVGTIFGEKYRIHDRLGQGGMGVVYLAEHIDMRREVALKVLRRELVADPAMAARFRRESQAASRVESLNVVSVYDFGETEDGTLYIAMERLRGENLATLLHRRGFLPPAEAIAHAEAITRALVAAHEAAVAHRDLKPDNVMITDNGDVKVLDFSIAKILESNGNDAELTQIRAVIGTARYMSPEAVARKHVGRSADLYALGVMLFEMLVGRPPFDDEEPVMLMGMHLRVPAELIREARPDLVVPDSLETLVDELLAKEPEERPPSARAVGERLAGIRVELATKSVVVPSPPAGVRDSSTREPTERVVTHAGTELARKRGGLLIGAAGLLALLIIGGAIGAFVTWPPQRNDDQREAMAVGSEPKLETEDEPEVELAPGVNVEGASDGNDGNEEVSDAPDEEPVEAVTPEEAASAAHTARQRRIARIRARRAQERRLRAMSAAMTTSSPAAPGMGLPPPTTMY